MSDAAYWFWAMAVTGCVMFTVLVVLLLTAGSEDKPQDNTRGRRRNDE